ncbi:MAG: peptidylprolyl isomerase [Chloroflexi bacterium]|nr:peptidylprolyl isomerase [Chloroflexota bacterium]
MRLWRNATRTQQIEKRSRKALVAPLVIGVFLLMGLIVISAGINRAAYAQSDPPPGSPTPTMEGVLYTALAGHTLGLDDAPLTIVMYGDFQCALCARYARDLEILRSRYPDKIRLIWRHLPDPRTNDKTALALQASEAAAAQGQFWLMHDQLFTHQTEWAVLSISDFRATLNEYAALVGLDVTRFEAELDAGLYAPVIDAAQRDAAALEIVGIPTLLFNGSPFSGRDDLFGLDEAARLALLERRQFDAAPEMQIDLAKNYRATLVLEKGNIVINLFDDQAPAAVNNFIFLARQGWFDNMTFYYVLPDFVAETGDPSDTGRGSPGYTIPDEHANGLGFDRAGLVAMAHPPGVPNSAGSAFFITLAPLQPSEVWDGQYTIFGEVIEGLDLARSLTPRNANDPVNFPDPPPGDKVLIVTVEEY